MEHTICPKFDKAIHILGKPWVGLLIYLLLDGPKRFHTLEKQSGISARVLSVRLKELEKEDIITREVFPEVPIRVCYSLTPKGRALDGVVDAISTWADSWVVKDASE